MIKINMKGMNEKGCLVFNTSPFFYDYSGLSDNQCEWNIVVDTMRYISGQSLDDVEIHIDSLLVFKQLNGIYRIKSKALKPIYYKYNTLKNRLRDKNIVFHYISGNENIARKYIR